MPHFRPRPRHRSCREGHRNIGPWTLRALNHRGCSARAHSPVRYGTAIAKASSPVQLLPTRLVSSPNVNTAILPSLLACAARSSKSHRRRPNPESNRPASTEPRQRCRCRLLCQRSTSPQTLRETFGARAPRSRQQGPRRLRRNSRGQNLSTITLPHPFPRLMVHPHRSETFVSSILAPFSGQIVPLTGL